MASARMRRLTSLVTKITGDSALPLLLLQRHREDQIVSRGLAVAFVGRQPLEVSATRSLPPLSVVTPSARWPPPDAQLSRYVRRPSGVAAPLAQLPLELIDLLDDVDRDDHLVVGEVLQRAGVMQEARWCRERIVFHHVPCRFQWARRACLASSRIRSRRNVPCGCGRPPWQRRAPGRRARSAAACPRRPRDSWRCPARSVTRKAPLSEDITCAAISWRTRSHNSLAPVPSVSSSTMANSSPP